MYTGQFFFRLCDCVLDEVLEVIKYGLDKGLVVNIGIVFDIEDQPVITSEPEADVELSGFAVKCSGVNGKSLWAVVPEAV